MSSLTLPAVSAPLLAAPVTPLLTAEEFFARYEARPGRIDQALEVPLPDADCRRRLIELYGQGLNLELNNRKSLIKRTEGVSAAFLRELLRRAAVFAAEENGEQPLTVREKHVEEALRELVVAGGQMTRTLLGSTARRDS